MTAYTDFHYSPTGSGVISGSQVLEQTEQGINGLGQYVQDNVSGAIDTANEALTTARSADSNATTAINLANSFNAQIIAANQTAGNALTTAQSAQNTANAASSLATTADNNATTALNAANSASAGVTTLTGTVNSLGNRMTAAENAINTNAGNITTLQNGLATTNANVTAAANAASSAQATATSAQSTATLARNQAYVLRYTGTTITGGGTIAYADIDNTDNIKAGDKIIDATGAIYEIASVDIANETVTVSASEIINLAVLPDLFNSANTWTGDNTFSAPCKTLGKKLLTDITDLDNAYYNGEVCGFNPNTLHNPINGYGNVLTINNAVNIPDNIYSSWITQIAASASGGYLGVRNRSNGGAWTSWTRILTEDHAVPTVTNTYDLGSSSYKWKSLNGINPGALSLPNLSDPDPIYTNNWVISTPTNNVYTPSENGWLNIVVADSSPSANEFSFYVKSTNFFASAVHKLADIDDSKGKVGLFIPVMAGITYYVVVKGNVSNATISATFFPCFGSV